MRPGELGAAGGSEGVDPVEQRLERGEALGLDDGGVHAGLEVVADLLLVGRAGGAAGLSLLEDGVELLGVDVEEDVEGVDLGLVRRDGVVCGEFAAGELVHIGAGVGGEIDGREVEAGEGLLRRGRGGRGRLLGEAGRGQEREHTRVRRLRRRRGRR